MPTFRESPYGAFNFIVALGSEQGDGAEGTIIGGFSDVSGLGSEIQFAEYRNGNERFNTVRKIPNTYKTDDVTLKRGLVGSDDMFKWLKAVREGQPDQRASITITLLDEAREPVATWKLRNVWPKKYTGPTLAAQGGTEVAMEELVLSCEDIGFE